MRLSDALNEVKAFRPDSAFTDAQICDFIRACENTVYKEILREETSTIDTGNELSAPEPYSRMYALYAIALMELYLGEYAKYNNTMSAYAELYDGFAAWYARNNRPKESMVKIW